MRPGAVACVLLAASVASAQAPEGDPVEARRLFELGVGLLEDQQFAEAAATLERSLAIRESPPVLYNLGLAYRGTGQYRRGLEVFARFLEVAGPRHAQLRGSVETISAELTASLVHVTLQVTGGAARVVVDDAERAGADGTIELTLDPGRHSFEASREGYEPARREMDLGRGERITVELDASQAPRPAHLVVDAGRPDAEIRLDGADVGRGRFEREVSAGRYEVRVSARGYVAQTRTVELGPGGRERLAFSLAKVPPRAQDPSLFSRWWFWTAAAVVASGAAVGVVVLTQEPEREPYYDGSLGYTVEAALP
jgi:hypothetical protein